MLQTGATSRPRFGLRGLLSAAQAAFNYAPLMALPLLGVGCARENSPGYQGYVEADFIHVSAPLAGEVESLAVERGAHVTKGAPLFTLERAAELAAYREATDRWHAAESRLEDLKKGVRPSEIATLEARLEQARAAAELSQRELARQQALFETRAVSASDFDRARLLHERDRNAVNELTAQLETARQGGRSDAIAAAEADVAAAAAAKERAQWAVSRKVATAQHDGVVHDVLFHRGEFVPAGRPILVLLPPELLKIRFFVPEAALSSLRLGDTVDVLRTAGPGFKARIDYVSPKAEYTPPVLYNRENRAKLVFMVEASVTADVARELHPGQPVDVRAAP